jgi:hypothetical protein
MFTPLLREKQRQEEWESIKQTARNNTFPISLLFKLKQRIHLKHSHPTPPSKNSDTKWASFTYTTPHIRKITNIFKQTNVKIAFKNQQHNCTTHKTHHQNLNPTACQ